MQGNIAAPSFFPCSVGQKRLKIEKFVEDIDRQQLARQPGNCASNENSVIWETLGTTKNLHNIIWTTSVAYIAMGYIFSDPLTHTNYNKRLGT